MHFLLTCSYIRMLFCIIALSNVAVKSQDVIHHILRRNAHSFQYGDGEDGPANWHTKFKECGHKYQSPINIDVKSLQIAHMPKLTWNKNYYKMPDKMTLTYNGHTLVLHTSYADASKAQLSGGLLKKTYNLEQIHFHWGTSEYEGSEHTLNDKSFSMEMHAVYLRSDVHMNKSSETPSSLAVVGYFFNIANKSNVALDSVLEVLSAVAEEQNKPEILTNKFPLTKLLKLFEREYVAYSGSLTTPPCSQVVEWIISPYVLKISEGQIEKFRSLIQFNYRSTQPLNGRKVYFVTGEER